MKKILIPFLLIIVFLTNSTFAFADEIEVTTNLEDEIALISEDLIIEDNSPGEITPRAAVVMDLNTGTLLYEKNKDDVLFPASITKIMTTLLALEYDRPDDIITFSYDAIFGIDRYSSHIALDVGEQITMDQALHAVMIRSANEACAGIAEHISGTISNFAKAMTEKAISLGCENTNFSNPHGLHSDDHYTTAYDMALIAQEAYKYEEFRNLMSTTYYEIAPTNKQKDTRYLHGQNKLLLPTSEYKYEGYLGGKTGFTDQAGNTLVSFAKKGDTTLICVVLLTPGAIETYNSTTTLLDYCFDNFETIEISEKPFILDKVNEQIFPVFQNFEEKFVIVEEINAKVLDGTYVTVAKNTDLELIEPTIVVNEPLVPPISESTVIGKIEYAFNDSVTSSIDLYSASDVAKMSDDDLFLQFGVGAATYNLNVIILIICSILFITIMRLLLINRRRRYNRYYRNQKNYSLNKKSRGKKKRKPLNYNMRKL